MIVLRFGGSSVASADTIKQVHQVPVSRLGSTRMLVVFSAFQGITNQLLSTGAQAAEGDPHYRDVNVILITQASSEYSITVAIEESHVPQAVSCLEEEFELDMSRGKINPVGVETGLSIVALVGDNMRCSRAS